MPVSIFGVLLVLAAPALGREALAFGLLALAFGLGWALYGCTGR